MRTTRFNLIAVLIVKNEESYLDEWIAYHLTKGFEHFIIYDNSSTDNTLHVLTRYLNHGIVTLIHWPQISGQTDAYRHSHLFFGHLSEWMAFLDIDEFVQIDVAQTVFEWLGTLPENVSQILIPWRNFLPSGHYKRPLGLVLESYFRSEPVGDPPKLMLSKPIIRSADVDKIHVHRCGMRDGITIDPNGNELSGSSPRVPAFYNIIFINHFFYRSVEEYKAKLQRGQVDGGKEKVFVELDSEFVERGGVYTPIEDKLVSDTKLRLLDLQRYSPFPASFGSHLLDGRQGHNITHWKFNISYAGFVNKQTTLSLNPGPAEQIFQEYGTSVVSFRDHAYLEEFFISSHFKDFLRLSRLSIHNSSNLDVCQRKIAFFIVATIDRSTSDVFDSAAEGIHRSITIYMDFSVPKVVEKVSFQCDQTGVILIFKYLYQSYYLISDTNVRYESQGLVVADIFVCLQD